MLKWEIVHECDNEETGKPTLWAIEVNSQEYGKFIWVSRSGKSRYNVEVLVDGEYTTIKTTRSLKSAKEWVEQTVETNQQQAETRTLSYFDLRTLCIRNQWFTHADCRQYDDFLSKADKLENVTMDDLAELAADVMKWSDTDGAELEDIMDELASACTVHLSQTAEAMPTELESTEAETKTTADQQETTTEEVKTMTIKEFRATIEALEAAHVETCNNSNNPHETARRFIRAVGADTAAQCVAAMVRRLHWDGRISRTARQWAESVELPAVLVEHIRDTYTSIHTAHLSQIAEAQPAADRYLEQVAQADSLDELDSITETAANDDTLTGAEYEAVHAAALRKAQEWDPQNRPQELSTTHTISGHPVTFSTCTAISASIGDTARQPALFVHDCTDQDGNGDGVIFGVETPPETAEEAAALLEEHLDTYQETLETVELAQREGESLQEPTSRPMYKTIPEALAIFDSLDPASVHTITEDVRGETMTGTPAELVRRIIEQDKQTNGNVNHGFTTVEGAAIIESAYALSDGEAITTDDGRTAWTGRKR